MGTEIIGGLIVGFLAKDWLCRFVLPCAVGLIACGELFFALRKRLLAARLIWKCSGHHEALRTYGMSEEKIQEVEQTYEQILRMPPFQELGMTGWKLYARQFVGSSLTALPFSLIAGAVRVFLIDK